MMRLLRVRLTFDARESYLSVPSDGLRTASWARVLTIPSASMSFIHFTFTYGLVTLVDCNAAFATKSNRPFHTSNLTIASLTMFMAMLWVLALVASVAGKDCRDFMIPVSISARQGVYNVPDLQHNLDATTFNQNLTSIRGNFTNDVLTGYADVSGNYYISAQFCQPDQPSHSNGVVQLLIHGIGFDKSSVVMFLRKSYWESS